jgi:hypothetical protein
MPKKTELFPATAYNKIPQADGYYVKSSGWNTYQRPFCWYVLKGRIGYDDVGKIVVPDTGVVQFMNWGGETHYTHYSEWTETSRTTWIEVTPQFAEVVFSVAPQNLYLDRPTSGQPEWHNILGDDKLSPREKVRTVLATISIDAAKAFIFGCCQRVDCWQVREYSHGKPTLWHAGIVSDTAANHAGDVDQERDAQLAHLGNLLVNRKPKVVK